MVLRYWLFDQGVCGNMVRLHFEYKVRHMAISLANPFQFESQPEDGFVPGDSSSGRVIVDEAKVQR